MQTFSKSMICANRDVQLLMLVSISVLEFHLYYPPPHWPIIMESAKALYLCAFELKPRGSPPDSFIFLAACRGEEGVMSVSREIGAENPSGTQHQHQH